MKAYTIPISSRTQRGTIEGVIVKASSIKEAKSKTSQIEGRYLRSSRELNKSDTHSSTVDELNRSDINGKEPVRYNYKYVNQV